MLHLLSLHHTVPERAAEPFIPGRIACLERHHQDGTFPVSCRTVPTSVGGVVSAHGVDRSAIEHITAQDPCVLNDVAEYTVTTTTPGRAHPALGSVSAPNG